jgi:hypothetical protein
MFIDYGYWATSTSFALAGVASALAAYEFWSWNRLRHIPGPFWGGWSIYYMNKLAMSGRLSAILKEDGEYLASIPVALRLGLRSTISTGTFISTANT